MQNQKEEDTKIVLTGGHAATPALGVVEEIAARKLNWKLYWVGPVSAMEAGNVPTAAEKILTKYGVNIKKIVAGRALRRGSPLVLLRAYFKIPIGFFQAYFHLRKLNPDIVISFGGFAALPVVFNAWLMGKKIVIQEQITGAGLANKLSSPFANKIFIARSESLEVFPKKKTTLIGNPQVSDFFSVKAKNKIGNPSTLFITGGSSGSVIINGVVDSILETLLKDYFVIHQTGEKNAEYFIERKEKLEANLKSRYTVFGYTNPEDFSKCFEKADIIVSRAGANTIADIVVAHRPAILIPIPWAIGNEQMKNAKKAVVAGIAVILEQEKLTSESLLLDIEKVRKNWSHMVTNVNMGDYALDKNAAQKFVDGVVSLLES